MVDIKPEKLLDKIILKFDYHIFCVKIYYNNRVLRKLMKKSILLEKMKLERICLRKENTINDNIYFYLLDENSL